MSNAKILIIIIIILLCKLCILLLCNNKIHNFLVPNLITDLSKIGMVIPRLGPDRKYNMTIYLQQ